MSLDIFDSFFGSKAGKTCEKKYIQNLLLKVIGSRKTTKKEGFELTKNGTLF